MARSVWVGAQVGGRLILLICESCQRPLEDESVSGRVTYSYNPHTEGGSDSSSGPGGRLLWRPTGSICFLRSHNGFELGNQLKGTPEKVRKSVIKYQYLKQFRESYSIINTFLSGQ